MNLKKWSSNHLVASVSFLAIAVAGCILVVAMTAKNYITDYLQREALDTYCQIAPPQNAIEVEQRRPRMEQCLHEATVAVINLNDQEAELLAEDPIDFNLVDRVNNAANGVMKVLVVLKEAEKKFFPPPAGQSLAKK